MAKEKKKKQNPTLSQEQSLTKELASQFEQADRAIAEIRDSWEEKERIFFGKSSDEISGTTKSQVFDPRLSTIIMEKAKRVMAQVPTGKVIPLSSKDEGKAKLLNLILQKYIIPNANSQKDFLTKARMWDVYSLIYGSFAVLAGYRQDEFYTGPDFWLIPARNIYPQPGVISVEEADYVFVDNWVTLGWLKKQNKEVWKNIDKVEEAVKEGGKSKSSLDSSRRSYVEQKWMSDVSGGKGDYAWILLRTRYEKDRWITFVPYLNIILRDIENPFKNNKIPIVVKDAFPLIDRFFGLGEIERAETLQKALNSLWNLYLDGVKYSIWPPMIVNPDGVVDSSIIWEPAAKWLETIPNSIREFRLSPQGLQTFQFTHQALIAAILNQAGTTDTSVASNTDMALGKTPKALQMIAMREAAGDAWDRFMMEKALEKLFDLFIDILLSSQAKPIKITLFAEEIKLIEQINPDLAEMYESGKYGEVKIRPQDISEAKYKFSIDAGTTLKKEERLENEALTSVLQLVLSRPEVLQAVREKGKDIDLGELIKRWIITSGITDWDKIVVDYEQPQQAMEMPPGEMPEQMGGEMPEQTGATQAVPELDFSQFQDEDIRRAAQELFRRV